jgi:hypothetical protein
MYRALLAILLALMTSALAFAGTADLSVRFLQEGAEGEYNILCPAKIARDGELRIAFDATDDNHLSYLRISKGKASLHRVAGASTEMVGKARPVGATGWHEITLQRRTDRVRVVIAGEMLIDAAWSGALGGSIGVGSSGDCVASEPMIQPAAAPFLTDDFTREADAMGAWETAGGVFENTMVQAEGADPLQSTNPFSLQVSAEQQALATTGHWFWDSYQASVSLKPLDAGAVGLCVWVQDEANYLQLRWRPGDESATNARQLVLVRGGQERVLASAPGGFRPGDWYRLQLRVTPGHIDALIDRELALQADTTAFGQGAVALSVTGGSAFFDDVLIASNSYQPPKTPEVKPIFLDDEIMGDEEIFLPSGLWCPGRQAGEFWHWGEFYDDATATIPLELLDGDGLTVLLRSGATDTVGGYRVEASAAEGKVTLNLARDGEPVTSAGHPLSGDSPLLVSIAGGTVNVSQDGQELLAWTDPVPLTGHRIALLDAPPTSADVVIVSAERFQDYVFEASPTDWFAGKGIWNVTTRWPCSPAWTFYGGIGSENPVVWTKHGYNGDMVLEWFGALQSDNLDRIRYTHPSDVNATICGNGRDVESGYSFVVGGWDNSKTAILRNGEVVAETSEVVLPEANGREMTFHKGWSRIRVEKVGNHISFWYENRLILEYTDPEPLTGGRVGLWSFHNELVVGRVRLWYTDETAPGVVRTPERKLTRIKPVIRPSDATEILNDFEADTGEWQVLDATDETLLELDAAGGRKCLRVTNQEEGGPFTVLAVATPFSISEWPVLSFDYRLTPQAKLNIYVLVDDTWHALGFTGEQFEWDGVPVLGDIPDVLADDKWHHAQVNLLELLQGMYPQLETFTATQVALAPPLESYVRCGIGGNGRGTQYWIDNFRIGLER